MTLAFYAAPLLGVLILGPLTVAFWKRSGNAWFVTQILAMFGLVGGIIVNNSDAMFGAVGPVQALVLVVGAAIGVALGALIFFIQGRRS